MQRQSIRHAECNKDTVPERDDSPTLAGRPNRTKIPTEKNANPPTAPLKVVSKPKKAVASRKRPRSSTEPKISFNAEPMRPGSRGSSSQSFSKVPRGTLKNAGDHVSGVSTPSVETQKSLDNTSDTRLSSLQTLTL